MNFNHYSEIIIVCAHPDDELIFFGPLLFVDNPEKKDSIHFKVYCLTCSGNIVRNNEFSKFMDLIGVSYHIYDFPIIRGFNIFNILRYYKWLKNELNYNLKKPLLITHSLYGDDHFHPQHIFLSLATLLYSIISKKDILFSNNYLYARDYLNSLNNHTLKRNFTFYFKKILLSLSRYIFSKSFVMECHPGIVRNAINIYKSQNLNYQTLIRNKFHFSRIKNYE